MSASDTPATRERTGPISVPEADPWAEIGRMNGLLRGCWFQSRLMNWAAQVEAVGSVIAPGRDEE